MLRSAKHRVMQMGSGGLLLNYFIFIHIFSHLFDFTTQNICSSRGRVYGGGGGGGEDWSVRENLIPVLETWVYS